MRIAPKQNRTWDVFLSYNAANLAQARSVSTLLKQVGWKTFLAHDDLNEQVGSAEWSTKVDEALDQSGALALIVTPQALASRWVEYEWRTVHTDILADKPGMIVPCLWAGPGPEELPRALRRYQSVDFRGGEPGENGIQLLDLIEGYLKKPIGYIATRRPTRILSIDAGGMRSLTSLRVLESLERKLDAQVGRQVRLADHFDLVAGSSIGGLIACLLLAPTSPGGLPPRVSEVIAFLRELAPRIFQKSLLGPIRMFASGSIYSERNLLAALDQHFGELTLKELALPCLIPAYNVTEGRLRLFRQHHASATAAENYRIRDVLRAALAAPVYLPSAVVSPTSGGPGEELIDGALVASNPARLAFDEVRAHFAHHPLAGEIALLSLGNISTPPVGSTQDWNALRWASAAINIAIAGAEQRVHETVMNAFESADAVEQYLRIEKNGRECNRSFPADDTSEETALALLAIGDELASRFDGPLNHFADLLVSGRTEEAESEASAVSARQPSPPDEELRGRT